MTRYCVLRHTDHSDPARNDHYDLLLEQDHWLATWEIQQWPPTRSQPAERLPDHRLEYLQNEGPVGGGRGTVRRVSEGTLEWLSVTDQRLVARLSGRCFSGVIHLSFESDNDDRQCWTLSSESATDSTGVSQEPGIA